MSEQKWNPTGFVESVIKRVAKDTGFSAVMRRADNPNQCSAAWEYLVPYCNIADDRQRLAFALIGAAIAREKLENDGMLGIGEALRKICTNDDDVERESKHLRRLIACDTVQELVPVLRQVIRFIQSKGASRICFVRLLNDLLYFNEDKRIRWTQEFFRKKTDEEENA